MNDPEHPLTLEQLKVASLEGVTVDDAGSKGAMRPAFPRRALCGRDSDGIAAAATAAAAAGHLPSPLCPSVLRVLGAVDIFFTPTIPHCSMATLIGLSIRVKLLRALPSRFKVRGAGHERQRQGRRYVARDGTRWRVSTLPPRA